MPRRKPRRSETGYDSYEKSLRLEGRDHAKIFVDSLGGAVRVNHSPDPKERRCYKPDHESHHPSRDSVSYEHEDALKDLAVVYLAEPAEKERKHDC